jgi:hypothetical protein
MQSGLDAHSLRRKLLKLFEFIRILKDDDAYSFVIVQADDLTDLIRGKALSK